MFKFIPIFRNQGVVWNYKREEYRAKEKDVNQSIPDLIYGNIYTVDDMMEDIKDIDTIIKEMEERFEKLLKKGGDRVYYNFVDMNNMRWEVLYVIGSGMIWYRWTSTETWVVSFGMKIIQE